ncbi:FimV/HubP family polar landmark protein [Burkholderia latens]|uniref:FimV/HubP family polar landmark protein n=1 Tax=Burkholderia latens TaxID=488446 RepID=UPI001AE0FF05|nr:FimV/HubP family polar landmark protein [Burkholderia latens]MBR7964195.1 pilus assembly protein FimV [Burkholderia vietnamiensis]QTO46058.1 pilus assembly protein FimV [Burkholderia latens]
MSRISLFPRQSRLSRAVRGALAILALGAVASAWAAGAGDLPASAAGPAPLTVTVQPGQSLNDLAKAATQSHDPAVLARAGRALFDANPQAFMKRDPSRLKVGATLTVPALDPTGAALASAGASAASAASAAPAVAAASGPAAVAQHGASAPHPGSAAQGPTAVPAASVAHPAPVSGASGPSAAGASASMGASAAHGASTVDTIPPVAPAAGASGPHVWSGSIQSAPSSASDASVLPAPGAPAQAMHEPSAAAPVAAASQPRPSSLQQLLALKNRVLMELQKHGIGKPAATNNVAPAPAPLAPRPAANDAPALAAASSPAVSEAAAGGAASAAQPASAPVQPRVPATAAARASGSEQIDWRPAAAAGAAVIVLAAGFAWRKRRNARRADGITPVPGGSAAADDGASTPPVEPLPPILPETPLARDAAGDPNLVTAAAAAAEAIDSHAPETLAPEVSSRPEPANANDAQAEAVSTHAAPDGDAPQVPDAAAGTPADAHASLAVNDAQPATKPVADAAGDTRAVSAATDAQPAAEADVHAPSEARAAPAPNDAQHAALMQNAISALNSLDMPLPPRTAEEPATGAAHTEAGQGATNGQSAQHPPVGTTDPAHEHPADQHDEFDGEPDAPTPAAVTGNGDAATASPLPPLGGAQFGALKLDFDLDLPSTPGAVLPALTPEELARIARNKLDLASEYVELGDLSGARTLLQEVVDANDAATRDDARALLAKLADHA